MMRPFWKGSLPHRATAADPSEALQLLVQSFCRGRGGACDPCIEGAYPPDTCWQLQDRQLVQRFAVL